MPLLGFTMFKEALKDGRKRQTIRKLRKKPIQKRDQLYLYWHLRRKDCEEIGTTFCRETFFITISGWPSEWRIDRHDTPSMFSGRTMLDREALDLAKRDGFNSVDEMLNALIKISGGKFDDRQIWQVIQW